MTHLCRAVSVLRHQPYSTWCDCSALYFVGGYDRTVEKFTLGYAAEHILTLTAAGLVSAMLIYSAATFDQTMKPSRGVLLLSFAIFLPLSLAYRRWIRQYVVASSVVRSFLVIGGGATAARFYEAYKKSSNGQQLEFVDVNDEHVGKPIAGEGSPDRAGKSRIEIGQP